MYFFLYSQFLTKKTTSFNRVCMYFTYKLKIALQSLVSLSYNIYNTSWPVLRPCIKRRIFVQLNNICKLHVNHSKIMYKFRRDGISVLVVMDRRRKKNNGLYPVKVEVVYRRIQKYFPTGKDVSVQEWEMLWKSKRLTEKAASIERTFNLIRNTVDKLADKGEFSFTLLEMHIGRRVLTVNEAIENKMKAFEKQGQINSFYRYRNTLRAVERFAGKNVSIDEITVDWLNKCQRFWEHDGKNPTTISIYMKSLKCIIKEAVEVGLIRHRQFPFSKGGYRIPSSQSRTMALTKDTILKIMSWKGDPKDEYWRDLWVFSYLCNGINFRDLLFLKRMNIVDGEVNFIRSKTSLTKSTGRSIKATLMPEMVRIIEVHGNGLEGDKNVYLFKHIKGNETPVMVTNVVRNVINRCNMALKRISDELGIPHFTTYAARHSFATVLMKNGTDISYISESLGHSNLLTTKAYLDGYDKEDRMRNSMKLLM